MKDSGGDSAPTDGGAGAIRRRGRSGCKGSGRRQERHGGAGARDGGTGAAEPLAAPAATAGNSCRSSITNNKIRPHENALEICHTIYCITKVTNSSNFNPESKFRELRLEVHPDKSGIICERHNIRHLHPFIEPFFPRLLQPYQWYT